MIDANVEFGDAFYNQITSIGNLLGEPARAKALNEGIANMINEITSKATGENNATAYACGMFYYGALHSLKLPETTYRLITPK